jgi:hypothetical protein
VVNAEEKENGEENAGNAYTPAGVEMLILDIHVEPTSHANPCWQRCA